MRASKQRRSLYRDRRFTISISGLLTILELAWALYWRQMQNSDSEVIKLERESASEGYDNHSIAKVNDHEIRISTMTEPYAWHCHPDSDESFLALEGGVFIEFEGHTVELLPGQLVTIKRGVRHRTRPIGQRSVNLTFERMDARTELLPAP